MNQVLGPDVLMWTADFFCKEPGTHHFVSWHQDDSYWGMENNDSMVSVWLAMSPVTVENGCMRMVPGVHKEAGFREHAEGELAVADAGGKLEDNMSSKGQCIARAAELEAQAEHVPLKPGDLAIFHLKTPHASAANVWPCGICAPTAKKLTLRWTETPGTRLPLSAARTSTSSGTKNLCPRASSRRKLSPPMKRPWAAQAAAGTRGESCLPVDDLVKEWNRPRAMIYC